MNTTKTYIVTTESTCGTEIYDENMDEYYEFSGSSVVGWFQAVSEEDAIHQARESNMCPHELSHQVINENVELSAFQLA